MLILQNRARSSRASPSDTTPTHPQPKGLLDRETFLPVSFTTIIEKLLKRPKRWGYGFLNLRGSLRCECLGHVLVFSEYHLRHTLSEHVQYFNEDRPHQGIDQNIPARPDILLSGEGEISVCPVLGGLHHTYTRRAA